LPGNEPFVAVVNETMKRLTTILLIVLFVSACKKDFDTKTFIVASQRATYTNWSGQSVTSIQVKENPSDPFRILGQEIEGFNYEEGFEYTILVKEYVLEDPPMDASNLRYVLKRIKSKK
jgi:hypothetical protein